jgi:hypothetical protein
LKPELGKLLSFGVSYSAHTKDPNYGNWPSIGAPWSSETKLELTTQAPYLRLGDYTLARAFAYTTIILGSKGIGKSTMITYGLYVVLVSITGSSEAANNIIEQCVVDSDDIADVTGYNDAVLVEARKLGCFTVDILAETYKKLRPEIDRLYNKYSSYGKPLFLEHNAYIFQAAGLVGQIVRVKSALDEEANIIHRQKYTDTDDRVMDLSFRYVYNSTMDTSPTDLWFGNVAAAYRSMMFSMIRMDRIPDALICVSIGDLKTVYPDAKAEGPLVIPYRFVWYYHKDSKERITSLLNSVGKFNYQSEPGLTKTTVFAKTLTGIQFKIEGLSATPLRELSDMCLIYPFTTYVAPVPDFFPSSHKPINGTGMLSIEESISTNVNTILRERAQRGDKLTELFILLGFDYDNTIFMSAVTEFASRIDDVYDRITVGGLLPTTVLEDSKLKHVFIYGTSHLSLSGAYTSKLYKTLKQQDVLTLHGYYGTVTKDQAYNEDLGRGTEVRLVDFNDKWNGDSIDDLLKLLLFSIEVDADQDV